MSSEATDEASGTATSLSETILSDVGAADGRAPVVERRPAPRGFATMSPERRREISRQGGVAAHRAGTAHVFTSAEARVAGRKGGRAARRRPDGTDSGRDSIKSGGADASAG